MRKNIFIKSMYRQIIRIILLMAIIAFVAFAFVLRVSEYIFVRNQLEEIANSHHAIGFVQGASPFADVSAGAEIINSSSHVRLSQRRRMVEGVMQGVLSGDIAGMQMGVPFEQQSRQSISMFTIVPLQIFEPFDPLNPWTWMIYDLEEDFIGFPEHNSPNISSGTWMQINLNDVGDVFEIGKRYFVKAFYPYIPAELGGTSFPSGQRHNGMIIMPINEEENLWVVPLAEGEEVDFNSPELVHLLDEIEFLKHNQSAFTLKTVVDMEFHHMFSLNMNPNFATSDYDPFNNADNGIMAGRLINEYDYINANPVAVIDRYFARIRGLNVGDTLTVTVSKNQILEGVYTVNTGMGNYSDFLIRSKASDENVHTLELEIVGILFHRLNGVYPISPSFVYIPDSVLPLDISLTASENAIAMGIDENYLFSRHYSFVLEDTRYEQEFFLNYREILDELGLELVMLWSGIGDFWAYAESIMLMVTFNTVIVSVVLVFVLALVAFLYLQQRRRDFAILRALGLSIPNIYRKIFTSVVFLGAIPMVIGALIARNFVISQSANTLSSLEDMVSGFEANAEISLYIIAVLVAIVFIILLSFIFLGMGYIVKRPVLEMLQGVFFKPRQKKLKTEVIEDEIYCLNLNKLSNYIEPNIKNSKLKNIWRFIFRHVTRSPVRSALGVLIAFSFIFTLGWLSESIHRTETEIENIYESVVIHGEIIRDEAGGPPIGGIGDIIRRRTVNFIRDSEFTMDVNYQANWAAAFVIAPSDDGTFPENWTEIIGFNTDWNVATNTPALDNAIGIGPLYGFIQKNTYVMVNNMMGSIDIEFLEGFDVSSFTYYDEIFEERFFTFEGTQFGVRNIDANILPIIVSQSTLEARGLSLGDTAYFVFRDWAPQRWYSIPAVVVGVHNEHIAGGMGIQESVILPVSILEMTMGGALGYHTLNFSIDPIYNRDHLSYIRDSLTLNLSSIEHAGRVPLRLAIYDEQLRNTMAAMNQTLTLLLLLYPVVTVLSVLIALGLAILLSLQFAKNVAIMRVLGATKKKACVVLCIEQLISCLIGAILALVLLIIIGWGAVFNLSILYTLAVLTGALIGTIIVTRREPLALLQVRE
ncbi:MAG: ABC transporter permease [Defluviitaleaceae bacterium]|nr:ABC transporter permease [Defluviitaleaceae bacterium]